jgi:hypothetical protein
MEPLNSEGTRRRSSASSSALPRDEVGRADSTPHRPPSSIDAGSTNLPLARRTPRLPPLPQAGSPPTRLNHMMAGPVGSAASVLARAPALLGAAVAATAVPAVIEVGRNVGAIMANPDIPASLKAASLVQGLGLTGMVGATTIGIGAVSLSIAGRSGAMVQEYIDASRQRVGDAAARARLEAGELHGSDGQNQLESFCRMLDRADTDLPPAERDMVHNALLNAAMHDNAHQAVADMVGHTDPSVRQRQAQALVAHPSMQALRETVGNRQDLLHHAAAVTLYARNSNTQAALRNGGAPPDSDAVAQLGDHEPIRDDEEYRLVANELQRQYAQREPGPSPAAALLLRLSTDASASPAVGASNPQAANTHVAIQDSAAERLLDEVIAKVRLDRANSVAIELS